MPSSVLLKAIGLKISPNILDKSDGGLTQANNVIIRRDNVIEPRRGFKLYGETFGSITDVLKQLFVYRSRIIRHFNSTLQFQNGVNNDGLVGFDNFTGTYNETEAGLRMKSIESNGNLYFTTSDGIKKISAVSGSDLTSSSISQAGGVKALDLQTHLNITLGDQTGFLPADSAVAYRVVWGIKDANSNIILGTPSQRSEIFNPLQNLLAQDLANVLDALDNVDQTGSLINDGNYVNTLLLPYTASASEIRTNLISLASKIDKDILYADNDGSLSANPPFEIDTVVISGGSCVVTFINATPGAKVSQYFSNGQKIYLNNFSPATSGTLDGIQTIASLSDVANSITFTTSAVGAVTFTTGTIESGTFRNITQPGVPSSPATNDQLVAIQTYLSTIILNLQSLKTQQLTANTTGTGVPLTIDTASCSVTAGVATITFSSGDPRDYLIAGNTIVLSGFTPTTGSVDGLQTVASTTGTTITFSTTAGNGAITVAGGATIYKNIIVSDTLVTTYFDTLDITTSANVNLEITIPSDVNSSYFYQVYRGAISQATGTTSLSELSPNDEMQLVIENFPSATELAAGKIIVEDLTPDLFKGANLYSNEASGEGILQSNDIPPFAKDINRFKNHIFYANTKTRHRKSISLLGVSNMLLDYGNGLNTKTFVAGDVNTSTDTITITSHGYTEGQAVVFSNATPSNLPAGIKQGTFYYVKNVTTNTFRLSISRNGSTLDITSTGSGTHTIHNSLPQILITDGTSNNLYSFIKGVQEVTTVTFGASAGATNTLATSGTASYVVINNANDLKSYVFWFKQGTATDPLLTGKISVPVVIQTTDINSTVANRLRDLVGSLVQDFTTSSNSNNTVITNYDFGYTTDSTVSGTGLSVVITTQGAGENASQKQVLLSDNVSPAISVDETAKSLVRVLNRNASEIIYGYYLSTASSVPGQMLFEGRSLGGNKFYVLGSNDDVGESFNPDLSPTNTIVSNTVANPSVVTTSTAHGLINGDSVLISNSNSTPSINGIYPITLLSSTSFSVPVNVTVAGTSGVMIKTTVAEFSENEEKKNRIYYSKLSQPEAVPIVNYLDVGATDKAILRIFPLRDSLFVYKEDGLFRISGETTPFTLNLFDSSCILIAPDTVSISNNYVYGWTTQGIIITSEAGVSIISRSIDTDILKLASSQYTNFKTATWGTGYESDNSYIVWTLDKTSDTIAKIAYRYSNLTNSWTIFNKTNTCGIVNPVDDRLYLGAGDINSIEQERKDFTRYDYADREFTVDLSTSRYFGNILQFNTIGNIDIGDVFVQDQTVTVYDFNQLLKKLDIDTGINDTDYYTTLKAQGGDNMRTKLVALATKLDADLGVSSTDYAASIASITQTITSSSVANPTVITTSASTALQTGRIASISGHTGSSPDINGIYTITVTGGSTFTIPVNVLTAGTGGSVITQDNDFRDILRCYNIIIGKLNSDTGVSFSNYMTITHNTPQEAVVTDVNKFTKKVTLNLTLDYLVGPITVYKAIDAEFTYNPNTFGDSVHWKQLREATVMFENKAFTSATVSFATDLLPNFEDITFLGDGNGTFGNSPFGSGFFGGGSNAAPFRTLVPAQKQRCRYMLVRVKHKIARETITILGMSLTGEVMTTRSAYR